MVPKRFREKVLVLVVCPCANDVSGRRRQSDKGYRVPVDHLHQGGVCVYVFDEGFLLFERFAWNETVDLMSHSVGESGKKSGDQRRSIQMTQKRRL